ncbi:hypothetical protein D9619_007276 [Psilocybe cf. subviscida]|uniref:Fungal N-terminal domain-containing protein n=1 Tax=Psilocybe cf. subviscida TaxID=2480587 RepID=A0A8H5B226_9AGAR|nr:hypothetical protein D9619_007276 [Psilocybe cf. subviscida]
MDPLSVTLTAVSLATAVKDIVELGQKIYESFAGASHNFRNAQRVAEDIKEMVEEIRVFCEDHQNVLSSVDDFRSALESLLDKFRTFETLILPLLPKSGGRRRGVSIRGWLSNNKVEESIADLQRDVVKVMRRHMMKSMMRSEIKLETIHQETSRGLEVLEVVQRDVSALRTMTATTTTPCSYKSSRRTSDEFDRNIIMFTMSTPSTSAPILRTPNVITEELMITAYIKLQVNIIVMTLEKMLALPASTSNGVAPIISRIFVWTP